MALVVLAPPGASASTGTPPAAAPASAHAAAHAAAPASSPTSMPADSLAWGDCRLDAHDEQGAQLAAAGAECATVAVPLDYARPRGRSIDVAISRIPADPARRRGVLLFNPGGPGGSGLSYPDDLRELLGEVADGYDLIGFDPRFVGRSHAVTCGPVRIADLFGTSVTRPAFERSAQSSALFAARCHERNPGLLRYASIQAVARDMNQIRLALGVSTLSYYGVSWGADLGVVYSQLFGDTVDRMVIDSVTDVEGSEYHHLDTGERTEAALDEWAAWAAWRNARYGLGRTGTQVRATVTGLLARAARRPIRIGGHRLDETSLPFLLQSPLGDESDYPLMARNVRTLVRAAAGHTARPTPALADLMGVYFGTDPAITAFAAASFSFTCNDRGWPRDTERYWRDIQSSRALQPIFAPNILPCAFWHDRTRERPIRIHNDVPMLIVQAERDNIPFAWAQRLHRKLTGSTLLSFDRRAHGVYDARVPCAVLQVNTYLETGQAGRVALEGTCG